MNQIFTLWDGFSLDTTGASLGKLLDTFEHVHSILLSMFASSYIK